MCLGGCLEKISLVLPRDMLQVIVNMEWNLHVS
jgi:hypothetical protein